MALLPSSVSEPWRTRDVARDLRRCLPDLVLFDLLFSLLAAGLLSPLLATLLRSFVAASGESAIGNFDLVPFLLRPTAMLVCLAVATLAVALAVLRLAGLMYVAAGALQDRRIRCTEALRLTARRAWAAARFGLAAVLLFALLLAPLLVVCVLLAGQLLSDHDINFYLHERPPEFWKAAALAGCLAVVTAIVFLLIIPHLLVGLADLVLQGSAAVRAFASSRRLLRGRMLRGLRVLLSWLIVWLLVSLAVNLAAHAVGWMAVNLARDHLRWLVAVLGSLAVLAVLLNYLLTFLGLSLLSLLIVRLHRETCEALGLPWGFAEAPGTSLAERRWPFSAVMTAAMVLVLVAAALGFAAGLLQTVTVEDRVKISAHRGSSLTAPENSLSAFQQAIEDGADYLEVDVQLTADGALVIAHDADLMRVAGLPLVVSQSTFAQLAQVDLGRKRGARFAGERIPTLNDVVELARGRVKLLVELKSYRSDARQLIARVVGTLRDAAILDDCVLMSLKYEELREAARLDPTIRTAFLASTAIGDLSQLKVDSLAVSHSLATDLLISAAHARHKQVYVWTIDDPESVSLMIDRGVDNIITNDPASVIRVLAERAALSTPERLLLRFRNLYEWR